MCGPLAEVAVVLESLPTAILMTSSRLAPAINGSAIKGNKLKLNRSSAVLCVLTISAMLLAGCGSDNNASTTTTGTLAANVNCGGKKTLKASGSTAQANA